MPDLNIKLNYTVRLSIKSAADAVEAYMNIPFFSLWDLVNLPKKREDKKKKDQFRKTLSQVKGFLSDILEASKISEGVDETIHVTCNRLCQIAAISDTDKAVLNDLEHIRFALIAQSSITSLEDDVITQIGLYYVFVWQKAQLHEALILRESRPEIFDLKKPKPVYPKAKQYVQYRAPLDSFGRDLDAALDNVSEEVLSPKMLSRHVSASFPVRKHIEHVSLPTFFESAQERCAPEVLLEVPESFVSSDRKRNLAARDGTTIEIRKAEHQKKKLKVEPEEAPTQLGLV